MNCPRCPLHLTLICLYLFLFVNQVPVMVACLNLTDDNTVIYECGFESHFSVSP